MYKCEIRAFKRSAETSDAHFTALHEERCLRLNPERTFLQTVARDGEKKSDERGDTNTDLKGGGATGRGGERGERSASEARGGEGAV